MTRKDRAGLRGKEQFNEYDTHPHIEVETLSRLIGGFRNKYHGSPLGRINASGIECKDHRAGLRGYVQFNKYTYIHTHHRLRQGADQGEGGERGRFVCRERTKSQKSKYMYQ